MIFTFYFSLILRILFAVFFASNLILWSKGSSAGLIFFKKLF